MLARTGRSLANPNSVSSSQVFHAVLKWVHCRAISLSLFKALSLSREGGIELKEQHNKKIDSAERISENDSSSELAYSPRFVTEIVDGVQRVDGGDAGVLQANDQVAEVFVLGHAEGVLADQDKVGSERPARRRRQRENPDNQDFRGVRHLYFFLCP